MQTPIYLRKFLVWRLKHINNRQFILLLSVVIGFLTGVSASIIKNAVHLIQTLLTKGFANDYANYLYFAYPAIGIFIAVAFSKYIIKARIGHGIPSVLHSISKNNGVIKRHNIFSSIVASAFTVGFGGSVGLEGPTVATGAAIGSNLGRLFHLNYRQVILMLGCACAGAMAAIFKAPVAAIVFALEVIMLDLTTASIVPLLLASTTAALTSYAMFGQNVLYSFELQGRFQMGDIFYYIVFGIIAGLISVYFTRTYMFIGGLFDQIKRWRIRLLIGGSVLGLMIFMFPSLYGEGYEVINACLKGEYSYVFNDSYFYSYKDNFVVVLSLLLGIVLLKVIASSVTFGSGGVGGIFAPTLFMGANTGLLFALFVNHFTPGNISESNFALVGMAGLISGVLHAPLTAIFLIAEITNGYGLFMPLMIVATISFATIKLFETNSVYTIQLARRKELITHNKDKAVLSLMKIDKLIEKEFKLIKQDDSLGQLVEVIAKSNRNLFPVVNDSEDLIGIVYLDQIRHIIFKPRFYDETFVRDLMVAPSALIEIDESMEEVAKKFHTTGAYNLPVTEKGKYLGFVSKANVFSAYRRMLKHFSQD